MVRHLNERLTWGCPKVLSLDHYYLCCFEWSLQCSTGLLSQPINADDTTIYWADADPANIGDRIERDLSRVADWINSNVLKMNGAKTQLMALNRQRQTMLLILNSIMVKVKGVELERQNRVRYVGAVIDEELTWNDHVKRVSSVVHAETGSRPICGSYPPCHIRRLLYQLFVLSHFDYCSVVWNSVWCVPV